LSPPITSGSDVVGAAVRRVDEELQRERAPRDLLLPRAVVRPEPEPAFPDPACRVEARLDVVAARQVQRLLVRGDQREHRAVARGDLERAGERVLLRLDRAGVPGDDGELQACALRDTEVSAVCDPGALAAPVEARLGPPLEPHRPFQSLDAPRELDPREQAAVLQRQRLGDADDAIAGAVRRLEDVRAPHVTARGLVLPGRGKGEAAAAIGVEDRGEGRRRVQARQRHEVHRAVGRDEGDRPAVADGGVGADRGESVVAFHPW
jgi:hypothetical protein